MLGRYSVQEKLGKPSSTPLMNRKYGSSEKYKRLVPQRTHDIVDSSKRLGESNEPESRKYIEKKKNKVKFIDKLPMESEKIEAHREPVLNKRKRVTGSGHNFKSKLAKLTKGTLPEKPRVSQAEKVPSYQETEEQVQAGNPKKQWLKPKVIYPQGPRNSTFINQETSSDDEWFDNYRLSHRLAYKKTKKAPAQEKGYENQTLLKRKQASQDNDRQVSFRADHCTKEILSPKKRPVKETCAGNESGKDSGNAEGCESGIISKKNQASKDEGAGNKIGKDCATAECFENQTRSMKKQAMKDRGSGNEMINDSAREERYDKQPSQKRQALKDKDLGADVMKESSREKYYENQTLTKIIKEVKDKGEVNDTGKDSSKEDHHKNRINSKKKQATKHQGKGDEIEKDSVAGEEHQENRFTTEEKQGVKDKGARKEIEKDSSREDRYENQIFSQKKQAVSDEGVDSLIDAIQKKCDKRMRKLNKKQQREVQELQKIWEEKISELKIDWKLELAIIRCLHKKNSPTFADKVKLVDGKFAKKMEDFNLLKDVQLKDLEANHLAAKKEEREKQDGWLDRAKPCQSSELKGVCGPESSGLQSEKVFGFPQPSTHDVVPITMHNVEDKIPCNSVRGNDVTMSEDFVSTDLQNGDQTGLSGALVNQRDETDETTTGGSSPIFEQMLETLELQASEDEIYQGVSAAVIQDQGAQVVEKQETSLVEEDASVPIDNVKDQVTLQIEADNIEIVDSVNFLQDKDAQLVEKQNSSEHGDSVTLLPSNIALSGNASFKRIHLGDAIGLPDASVNPGDETNKATISCLPLLEQLLEPPVLEDSIPQALTSAVIQYHGAQVVEKQNTSLLNRNAPFVEDQDTSLTDVAHKEANSVNPLQDEGAQVVEKQYTSDNVDDVMTLPSSIKVQEQEPVEEEQFALQIEPGNCESVDTVNHAQCDDALLICDGDELQIEAGNQSHNAEKNCPLIALMEETASVPQESSSQSELNGELLSNRNALGVEDQVTSLIDVAQKGANSVNPVQDEGAQVVEKQYTSDNVDAVMTLPSSIKVQDQEPIEEKQFALQIEPGNCEPVDTVNPAQCNDALLICDGDELQIEAENQSHNAERNCPQIALMEETASVPQESSSQSELNRELLSNRNALFVEDQVTSVIVVANKEVDSVNLVQGEGGQVVEKQYTSNNMDAVMTLPSNIEVQGQEPVDQEQFALQIEPGNCEPVDTVNPAQYGDVLLIFNGDELLIEAENQSHTAERNCPQIAQMEETALVPQESTSQSESNGELLSNIEHLTSSHNTIDFLHQDGLQPGSLEHLYGPSYLFPDPNHQVASYAATFRAELERIDADIERLKKSHEDMVSQLSLDRKKEMLEMIAQIDRKYKLKLQDAEAEFTSKKNGLEKNHKKAFQSKLLAEVIGYTCLGLCSVGLPGLYQAPVSSCMRPQQQQRSMSPHPVTTNPGQPAPSPPIAGWNIMRPPPVATFTGQPATSTPIPRPNSQSMQHQPLQHLIRPHSMATYPVQPAPGTPHPGSNLQALQQLFLHSQTFAPSHIHTARHAAAPGSFCSTSRPPVIGSITPSVSNLIMVESNLHSSRPTTNFQPVIQRLPPPPGFQNMPQVQCRPTGQSNLLDQSVMEHLLDVEDLVHTPLEQAYWDRQRLCSAQGYPITSRAVPPDSICISDDD